MMRGVRVLSIVGFVVVVLLEAVLIYAGREHLAYTDPSMALPPLVVLGVSLLLMILFWLRVRFPAPPGPRKGLRRLFSPAYGSIRETMGDRSYVIIAAVAGGLYALIFMWAEGAIKRDLMGVRAELLWEGVPGFMPQLTLFPWPDLGIRLSAYQMAAILFLCTLFGVNVALLVRLYAMQGRLLFRGRGLAPGLGGAAAGLLIACPSCAATPMAALVSAFLIPAGTLLSKAFGTILVYFLSVVLVVVGLSVSSQAVEKGKSCEID